MRRLSLFFLIFVIFFSPCVYSSDSLVVGKLSINEFLEIKKTDSDIESSKRIVEALKNSRPNTPYLEGVSFATRIERLNLLDQRLSLRFNTRSHRETVAERRYRSAILRNSKMDLELHKRYQNLEKFRLAINLIFSYRIYMEQAKLVTVYQDKVNVLEKMSQHSVDFRYRDLISAMDRLFNAQTRKSRAKESFLLYNRELSEYKVGRDGLYTVDDNLIITIAEIEEISSKLSQKSVQDNVLIKSLEREKEVIQLNYDLERATNRRVLDHVEARYNLGATIDDEDGEHQFSLGISLNLPFISSSRLDEHEILIDIIEHENEIENMATTLSQSISTSAERIRLLVDQYNKYLERQRFLTENDALNAYLNIDGIDPLAVLELKETTIANNIDIQTIMSEIYAEYINLLYVSGAFYTFASTNFLLTGVELQKSD